jgi:hypothetical protein
MTINRLSVMLPLLIATALSATAQTAPSITMGLTAISLGESANDAVSSLSHEYTVTVVNSKKPKTQEWLVSEIGSKVKFPIATLYAQAGKVVGFDPTVEIFDDASAQNAFNYFFSLVNKLTKENHNRCALTSGTSYLNGALPINKTFVDFTCGPYYFYILKNEYHDQQSSEVRNGYIVVERIGETD